MLSDSNILNVILFTPLVGAILMLFIPRERPDLHRWLGNIFACLGLARFAAAHLAVQYSRVCAAIPVFVRPRLDPFDRRPLHRGNRRPQFPAW